MLEGRRKFATSFLIVFSKAVRARTQRSKLFIRFDSFASIDSTTHIFFSHLISIHSQRTLRYCRKEERRNRETEVQNREGKVRKREPKGQDHPKQGERGKVNISISKVTEMRVKTNDPVIQIPP